jgi:hypothetical protein
MDFRDKLKEMQSQVIHQVRAERKKSNFRRRFKVVVPLLIVLVAAVYFIGKTMQNYRSISAIITEEQQSTEYRYPVPPDQTESKWTPAETGIADDGNHPNDLIIDSEEEMPDLEIPLLALEDENGEFDFEMHVETDSEAGTESEIKNHGSNYTLPNEDEDNEYLDSGADENTEASEIDQTDLIMPSTSVTSPYGSRITQLLVCSGVKDRNCIVRQSDFVLRKGQNPHVWMEVFSNSVPYVLKHVYYREGRKYVEVPLKIKYPRMRTWSFITLKDLDQLGSWHVEIVAEDGTVFGRAEFKVIKGS